MIEQAIIHTLLNHATWGSYVGVLDWPTIKQQTPQVYRILLCLKKWHEVHEDNLALAELPVWFNLQYPGLSDKEKAVYQDIFEQVAAGSIRDDLVSQYLQQLQDTQIRRQLAVMAIDDKVPNDKVIEQVGKLAQTKQIASAELPEFVTTDIEELLALDEQNPGLMWRLECLNRSIGPLRKGFLVGVIGRVESGKTAFWVSEITNFAQQLKEDEHVVVFFNEESGTDVMWRMYSAMTGFSAVEVESDPKKARELFYSRGGQTIKFVDQAKQTPTSMQKVLDALHPAVIVIDSLDKVGGFEDDRRDSMLGKVYRWARETAKTYAPVIGISQAGGDRPKKWLTEYDMFDSKTAKPAELDALIGIGTSQDAGYEYVRYINIPKNKRRGNRYTNEADRHGKFQTIIVPELSIYKDC